MRSLPYPVGPALVLPGEDEDRLFVAPASGQKETRTGPVGNERNAASRNAAAVIPMRFEYMNALPSCLRGLLSILSGRATKGNPVDLFGFVVGGKGSILA